MKISNRLAKTANQRNVKVKFNYEWAVMATRFEVLNKFLTL